MTHYTKKRIETVSNSFRKNALSVAISALSTTLAGVRDGLKGGVYVTLIAGQVVTPVVWAELPTGLTNVQGGEINADAGNNATSATYAVVGSRVSADWTSFGISSDSSVTFNQQNTDAILVNQVTGNSLSNIAGELNATGHIILVNPNGVTLAGTSVIDVNSLVVSGLPVSSNLSSFLNGGSTKIDFNSGAGAVTIENGANLSGIDQGVVLVGGSIMNGAAITVSEFIGMGAGSSGTVTFDSDGIVGFEVSGDFDSSGTVDSNAIKSTGALTAQQIFLTAHNASSIYNNAINLEGTVAASEIKLDGDTVRLGAEVTLNDVSSSFDIDNDGSAVRELIIGNNASVTGAQADAIASKVTIESGNTTLSNAQLTGADNVITLGTADISITDVNDINLGGGSIEGTTGTDTFDVTGANALTSAGIDFTNVATVNAGNGSDQVNTNGATLFSDTGPAVDYALKTQQITFTAVENLDLDNGALAGSDTADTFEVTGSTLTANAISVTNAASAINAGAGDDAVTVNDANSTLAGTDNALNTASYQFTSIENADLTDSALTGTSGADIFDVTGANALTSAGIDFTNVVSVNADDGNDQVTTDAASLVAGTDEALSSNSISFTDIESADLSDGTLAGTANADSFDVTGTNALTSAGIDFTSVAAVNADDGADQVNTDGADASLFAELGNAVDYALETLGITFRGTENADLNGGTLAGSSEADSFEVTGTALTANGISVTNAASAINAGNGDDSVIVNDANSTLTGTNNVLNTASYQFTSIESADLTTNALTGTSGADTFDVTGANALTSADIDFTNVASVDAGIGSDQVNTSGATLVSDAGVAVENALTTQQVAFTAVENLDLANGTLTGSDAADSFEVNGAALTANAISVTSAASAINAGDGADVLTVNDANSTLTGSDNELDTANYEFSSVETVDLADNALTGTANADTFDVTGANALTSAGINFSNVAAVNADDGVDQVNTDGADASLFAELGNAVDYALETLGITFRETENADLNGGTLAGSSEADSFEVTGTTLTANGISVTNAASAINAGNGDDSADCIYFGRESGSGQWRTGRQ